MSSSKPRTEIKSDTNSDTKDNNNDVSSTSKDMLSAVPDARFYDKSLDHMFYDTIDGVNYYSVTANGRMKAQIPIIQGLDLRCDDVIMSGYPKSGSHWIFEALTMVLNQNTNFYERSFHLNSLEFLNVEVQSVLDAIESPRCLNTHLRAYRFPLQVVEKRLKVVHILRNPKDIAVSLYSMFSTNGPHFTRYNGTFSEFFDLYLNGKFFWGSWFDYVWSYENFIKEHPEHPVFTLYFEKMKQEPVQTIRDLCTFLEKPDFLANDIARVTEFSNIKKTLLNGKMKLLQNLVCQKDTDFIFRKGEIGDWKNWLTTEQSEAVNKMFEERMAESKLAAVVREYM